MPRNGSLIGMTRIFEKYLGGCAIQTFQIYALSQIKAQCNKIAKCEALECNSSYFKEYSITVKVSEKVKLLSASILLKAVFINKYFKHRVSQTYGRVN